MRYVLVGMFTGTFVYTWLWCWRTINNGTPGDFDHWFAVRFFWATLVIAAVLLVLVGYLIGVME